MAEPAAAAAVQEPRFSLSIARLAESHHQFLPIGVLRSTISSPGTSLRVAGVSVLRPQRLVGFSFGAPEIKLLLGNEAMHDLETAISELNIRSQKQRHG